MRSLGNRKVVRGLVALLGPIHEGERLTSKEGEARDVDGHVASTRCAREAIEQSAAGKLEAEFIHLIIADG